MSDFAKKIQQTQQNIIQKEKEAIDNAKHLAQQMQDEQDNNVSQQLVASARAEIERNSKKQLVGFRLTSGSLIARTNALKQILSEFSGLAKVFAIMYYAKWEGEYYYQEVEANFSRFPSEKSSLATDFVLDFKGAMKGAKLTSEFVKSLYN